tara:strand:- start:549 stop:812 length:264 start_codon:yes stop_codon:yes gene_type:complete
MNDLDYTIAKNRLEILLLKAQESLKEETVTQSKMEAIETLQSTLRVMMELRLTIDELNKKNTLITLQNVKAYRQTAELKKKFINFKQ